MAWGGKNSSAIDRDVGHRNLNLSQAVLAERLGVTFQRVQKYERKQAAALPQTAKKRR